MVYLLALISPILLQVIISVVFSFFLKRLKKENISWKFKMFFYSLITAISQFGLAQYLSNVYDELGAVLMIMLSVALALGALLFLAISLTLIIAEKISNAYHKRKTSTKNY